MNKHLAFRRFRIPAAPTLTLAALLGFGGALPASIRAATYTWTGGGGNSSWSTGGNWSGGSAPALGQDTSLLFTGTTNLTPQQNITKEFSLNALTFDSAAGAFVLGGNALQFLTSSANVLPVITQNSAAAETVSNNLTLTNNLSLSGTGAGALTLSGALSDAGSLTMAGTGTAVLTGTNTYTGGTAFNGGTLNVGNAQALGTSGTLSFAGGTLQYSAASAGTDFSARFNTAGNQAISLDTNGNNVVIGTGFGGTGTSLTKLGAGTLTINGGNTYTGATALNGGVVSVNNPGALGSGTISFGGGTLQYGDTSHTDAQYNAADYSARFSTAANQAYSIDTNGHNITYGTGLTSSGGSLTKLGTGTLTLTGTSTYTGGTTVNAGTLAVSSGGQISSGFVYVNASGTLAISGTGSVSLGNTGTLQVDGTAASPASVTLSDSGVFSTQAGNDVSVGYNGAGSVTQTGGTFAAPHASLVLGFAAGSNGTYNLQGGSLTTNQTIVAGSGSGTFTQSGTSIHTTQILGLGGASGTTGTYNLNGGILNTTEVVKGGGTGTFNFNGGTLQASANNTSFFAGLTTASVQAGGATIDTNGFNVTAGQALVSGTAAGTADGGLNKDGAGTLTLAGMNTYTGGTMVNAGTLLVNGTLGGSGIVTVQRSSSVLGGTGTIDGTVDVLNGGDLNPGGNGGASGSAANVGELTVARLSLSNTATTTFDVNTATVFDRVVVNGDVALGGTLALNVNSSATFTFGQILDLIHGTGKLVGTFTGVNNGGIYTYGGGTFEAIYTGTDFELEAVPEPSTWALLGLGTGLLGVVTLCPRRHA